MPVLFIEPFSLPSTVKSRGVEVSLKGAVTSNLDLIANYTYVDSEIGEADGFLGPSVGEPRFGVPKHAFSLLASYRFRNGSPLEGLTLTGAVQYHSARLANNSRTILNVLRPAIELDPLLRFDVSGTYKLNDRVTIEAGVQNLLDEVNILPSAVFGLGRPDIRRTVFAALSVDF